VNPGPVLLALLLAVAALTWWLAYQGPADAPGIEDAGHRVRAAEVIARGTWLTTMGPGGLPVRTLRAAEAKFFDHELGTELQQPHFTIYRGEDPPWEVRAQRGWISGDGEIIRLEGEVVVERPEGGGKTAMRLLTERLNLRPDENFAATKLPVTLLSDNARVEAVGMEAWLGEPSRFKLLSKARGHYEPNPL
jgi:lipopolysaccharide export system protein LptC